MKYKRNFKKIVKGIAVVEAENKEEANNKFNQGEIKEEFNNKCEYVWSLNNCTKKKQTTKNPVSANCNRTRINKLGTVIDHTTIGKKNIKEGSPDSLIDVNKIVSAITSHGYLIADGEGMRTQTPCTDVIGIIKPKKKGGSWLGAKVLSCHRGRFIGLLVLNNEPRCSCPDEGIVLKVFGRKYLQNMRALADALPRPKNIDIHIRLSSEECGHEQHKNESYSSG